MVVTGGSGFIGTHLVQALMQAGARVTNLDINGPTLPEQAACWVRCDLRQPEAVRSALRSAHPEVIFNLAAVADISAGAESLAVNTVGLINVLEASHDLEASPMLVHFSTQYVVQPGQQPAGPLDFAPYTEYGATKAHSERLMHDRAAGLDWIIVRPTIVWGPWHPTFSVQVWRYLERGWYLHPTGRDPRRSYGYVSNVVHQVIRLAELDPELVSGRTLYVGDEPMPSSLWLDKFSLALRGKPTRRIPGPFLRVLAEVGEASAKLGGPAPINLGRLHRMTTDDAVPMETTFALVGRGPVTIDDGVDATVRWMRRGQPEPPAAGRRVVAMVGAFPPPLGGAAKATEAVRAALVRRGVQVHAIDTSGPTLSHVRPRGYHARRINRNLRGVLALVAPPRRGAAMYLVPDAGLGIWYSLAFAAAGGALFDHIIIHHHSCRYVDEDVVAARWLTSVTRRRATHIFYTAGMAARYRRRYGPVHYSILSNAWLVDDMAQEESLPTRRPEGDSQSVIRAGHLSNLCAEKGFFDVAAAFDAVRAHGLDAELLLAGPILEDSVQQRLAELQGDHGQRVSYFGPLFGAAKRDFFGSLDVFLFPTRFKQEAAPNVLFEAAAMGVPSLSVDRGCITEVLDALEGTACPSNEQFTELVVKYLGANAGALPADDRRTIRERFDRAREVSTEEIGRVLDEIAQAADSTSPWRQGSPRISH